MKVIFREPGKRPIYMDIPNELNVLQGIVGGYIEAVPVAEDVVVICNEEGRLYGLPFCWKIDGIDFVGPIVICGTNEEDFVDVPFTKELIDMVLEAGDYVEC